MSLPVKSRLPVILEELNCQSDNETERYVKIKLCQWLSFRMYSFC